MHAATSGPNRVLITGITGMDGSLMADYILKNTDFHIYGLVRRLSVPNTKNIKHLIGNPRVTLIEGDLSDPISIDSIVERWKPHYLINFAANSFVGDSWKVPHQHMEVNSLGVLYLLEAIRKHSPGTRFYEAGSSEMFGDVKYAPQDEKHPFSPRSPYGVSKCAAAHLVKVYRESYNLHAIVGTLFNHEGVRRGEQFVTRKITKYVAKYANGLHKEPLRLGNLFAKRDWSDAEDFVRGIWMMMNQDQFNPRFKNEFFENKHAKDYILASGETHTIKEFVELAFEAAGTRIEWANENSPTEIKGYAADTQELVVSIDPQFFRPAEVDLLLGDSTKAREELGWRPDTSFKELVSKMVANDLREVEI